MLVHKLHRVTAVVMLIALVLLAGCSSQASKQQSMVSVAISTEASKESSSTQAQPKERTITDMAGREVKLPETIDKVYGVNNNSTYLLYSIVPDKLIGWNVALNDDAKKYIEPQYADYPVVGILYGGGKQVSPEEILKYAPELIVYTENTLTQQTKATADGFVDKLGIPVIVVEANIHNYDKAYEFLGEVFGEEDSAKALADYYRQTYDYAKEKSALVKEKAKVYYAREDDGLTTDFKGSSHTEVFDLIAAENVAVATQTGATGSALGSDSGKGNGSGSGSRNGSGKGKGSGSGSGNGSGAASVQSGTVPIEQLLVWNPEVIVVGYTGNVKTDAFKTITTDAMWSKIDALKNGKVYEVPHEPFNWFDRPPSFNRIIGIKWLGHLLYPEIYDCDMTQEVKEFFKLYYHYALTNEETNQLLGNSK